MFRIVTGRSKWISLVVILWLAGAEASCFSNSMTGNSPSDSPVECPMNDMGDTPGGESESENDRETDDDNLFDEKSLEFDLNGIHSAAVSTWDLLHDDPSYKLNSPPPRIS